MKQHVEQEHSITNQDPPEYNNAGMGKKKQEKSERKSSERADTGDRGK